MKLLGFSYPWNFAIFVALLFALNAGLCLVVEWLERRRRTR